MVEVALQLEPSDLGAGGKELLYCYENGAVRTNIVGATLRGKILEFSNIVRKDHVLSSIPIKRNIKA